MYFEHAHILKNRLSKDLKGSLESDALGKLTLINARVASVMDLALVTPTCLDFVTDFKVISHAWSDHMPIAVSVKVEGVRADMLDSVSTAKSGLVDPRRFKL